MQKFKSGQVIVNTVTGTKYTFAREDFRGNLFGYAIDSTREQVLSGTYKAV
jgi:hypothetical protein